MIKQRKKRVFKTNLDKRPFFKDTEPEINPYELPKSLTDVTYVLVSTPKNIIRSYPTNKRNREDMLKELINYARNHFIAIRDYKTYCYPYQIYVIENGVKELLISSSYLPHKQFINFLCPPENN